MFAVLLLTVALASGTTQEVFAPFPSRIRIAVKDPQVRVSWRDSDDLDGRYLIYRHTVEITVATLKAAELVGVVDKGVESFIDTPPDPGSYYYAILGQDQDGITYEVVVPFRNALISPVVIETTATEEQQAAEVRNIAVETRDTTIVVSFDSGRTDRRLAVYRRTEPIVSTDDLARASRIATVPSTQSQVIDYPVPGVGYYYAVLDTELIAAGQSELVAGRNATDEAAQIPLPAQARPSTFDQPTTRVAGQARARPLPFFQIQSAVQQGSFLLGQVDVATPTAINLQPETDKAVLSLIRMAARPDEAKPTIEVLAEDRTTPEDTDGTKGMDLTLRTIVEGSLSRGNWSDTQLMLSNFLRLPLPKDLSYRAQFYLGQAYYYEESYREAALAFVLAQEGHYPQATRWLDRALSNF